MDNTVQTDISLRRYQRQTRMIGHSCYYGRAICNSRRMWLVSFAWRGTKIIRLSVNNIPPFLP